MQILVSFFVVGCVLVRRGAETVISRKTKVKGIVVAIRIKSRIVGGSGGNKDFKPPIVEYEINEERILHCTTILI